MRGQLRIDEVFVFIVLDEDGTEGIPAYVDGSGIVKPLLAADKARLDELRPLARQIAKGRIVRLVRFSKREELEVYGAN